MDRFISYKKLGSVVTLVAILLSSCYQSIPIEKPVLSEESLKKVLKDIHLAESLLTEVVNREAKDSLARLYYNQIFRLNKVKKEDFDQSMHAYFTDPAALDSLYAAVIAELGIEQKEILTPSKNENQDIDPQRTEE